MSSEQLIANLARLASVDPAITQQQFAPYQDRMLVMPSDVLSSLAGLLRGKEDMATLSVVRAPLSVDGSNKDEVERFVLRARTALEIAVRFGPGGLLGFAWLAVPRPAGTLPESLGEYRSLLELVLSQAGFNAAEQRAQLELFDIIYPEPARLAWLASSARTILFATGFRAGSNRPIIKLYYHTMIEPACRHDRLLQSAFAHLGFHGADAATAWDAHMGRHTSHRGLGLDLQPGAPVRLKLYERIPWSQRDLVEEGAAAYGVPLEPALWGAFNHHFQPAPGNGVARQFEVALVFEEQGGRLGLKVNAMFAEPGSCDVVGDYFAAFKWDMAPLDAARQALALAGGSPFLHACAMSLAGEQSPLNVYFSWAQALVRSGQG